MNEQELIHELKDENLCLKDEISILKLQAKNRLDENVDLVYQIDALKAKIEHLLEANETWRIKWAATEFDNAQLKAQVNCLREAALRAISYMTGGEAKSNLRDAYDATPEQCLAEVKAQVIEDVANDLRTDEDYHHNDDWYINYLMNKADKIREQAK